MHLSADSSGGVSLAAGRSVSGYGMGVLDGYGSNGADAGIALRVGSGHGGARLEAGDGDSDVTLALQSSASSRLRLGCEVGSDQRMLIEASGQHGLELLTPDMPSSNSVVTTPSSTSFVVRAGGNSLSPGACNGITVHHSSNYIGVGLSNGSVPVATLHVEGDAYVRGDVRVLSDTRAKTGLAVIDGALFRVGLLRGYTYEYHYPTNVEVPPGVVGARTGRSTGLLAQEVVRVLLEAVHTDDTGTMSLAYGNLSGLFVEAINELSAEVARLRAAVNKLTASTSLPSRTAA